MSVAEHREAFERFDPTDAGRIYVSDAVTALNLLGLPCDSSDATDDNCTGNDTRSHTQILHIYLPSSRRGVCKGSPFGSVCLYVCLSVCPDA